MRPDSGHCGAFAPVGSDTASCLRVRQSQKCDANPPISLSFKALLKFARHDVGESVAGTKLLHKRTAAKESVEVPPGGVIA
jgi:hypothetical protein